VIDASQIFDGTVASDPPVPVSITANATTQASTNILDWLVGRDVGAGETLGVHIDIMTAFTTTNSATLDVTLQVCATTNGTFLTIMQSVLAVPASQLIIGAPFFRLAVPVNQILNATAGILKTPGRYMRLLYNVGTGVFSAGAVFSYIVPRKDRNEYFSYAINYTAATVTGQL
jgi:hypothetical protein